MRVAANPAVPVLIEPVPFDGRVLGDWLPKLQPGLAQSVGLAVMTNESRALSHYNRSVHSFAVAARVVLRTYAAKARRQALLTNGASLIGQMLLAALGRRILIWTEAPLDDLLVEDGRVKEGVEQLSAYARWCDKVPDAHLQLGLARMKAGDKDGAAEALVRHAEIETVPARKAEDCRNAAGLWLDVEYLGGKKPIVWRAFGGIGLVEFSFPGLM